MKKQINLKESFQMALRNNNRPMRWCYILLFMLTSAGAMIAQSPVTGSILDSDGEPLIGATVIVKGTTTGTVTEVDGSYTINAKPDDILVFSYIGYISKEMAVGGQSNLTVSMLADAEVLDEVVVVGYGTRKKSHNTGAIASIDGGDIAAIQATRVDDALAGKLAGVLIQNQSGEPGADPRIQVRAASSLSGDASPLIVVDGYPITGSIATINPNDIESLEVLKDAASAAIYGSRGANGVILVTTKQGKSGKPQFSYNGYTSTSSRVINDADQLFTASEWASELQSGRFDLSEVDPLLLDYRITALANAPDVVSLQDYLFQNGNTQAHDFNVSAGSDNVRVFASVGYQDTEGIVQRQEFERYNGRLNVEANLGNRFTTGVTLNGNFSNQEILPHDQRDLLRAYSISPIFHTAESIAFAQDLNDRRAALVAAGVEILDGNGNNRLADDFDVGYRGGGLITSSIDDLVPGDRFHDWHYGRNQNGIGGTGDAGPAAKLDEATRTARNYYANANAFLQFEIAEGLNVKTVLGGDLNDSRAYFAQGVLADSRERTNQSDLDEARLQRSSVLSETTLAYNKVLDGVHDLGVVVGAEFQTFFNNGTTLRGTNLPVGLPLNFSFLAPEDITTSLTQEVIARRSVFGRINYAYDNRYLASVSIRRDGDSRFGQNNRFEVFPAFSLGWNVHNEDFFNNDGFLSDLKLRVSRGSLGTTSFLGAYDALSLLSPQATVFGTGFLLPENVANPDLTWQTNTETNVGVNIGFLQNRFTIGVDYYTSDIEDMLINQSVSEVLGTNAIILNRGDVTSSGWEFEVGANIVNTSNVKWSVSANLSTVDTEITSLGDVDALPAVVYGGPSGRGPEFRNFVGGEIGEMWGLETTGQVEDIHIADPSRNIGFSSSEYYVVDQNDDGVIDELDYVKLGSATPDFYYGLTTNLNIFDFDVSMQWQGSQGAEVYNIDPIYWESQFGNRLRSSFDSEGDGIADATGQFYAQTRNVHGALVQDASYAALRNLTIGYTLDPAATSKIGIGSIRLYVASTNLLYFYNRDSYTSFNPEGVEITNGGYLGPQTYGYQEGASPLARSFTFGANVNF